MKKRLLLLCVTLVCAITFCLPAFAAAQPGEGLVNAEAVYLYNLDTDTVVYEKNAHEVRAAASLTKMMTGLLLVESGEDLNQSFTIPEELRAEFDRIQEENGSDADLKIGETVTLNDLLYACMLPSANDAASVIAYYLGNGNLQDFFDKMNARAAALGCQNTTFTCAHGLYGLEYGNKSTAYDLFLIAKACRENQQLMDVLTQNGHWLPLTNLHTVPKGEDVPEGMSRYIPSTNVLQNPQQALYRSYIQGLKTGFTDEAGRCFASSAVHNGQTWLLVVLGAPKRLAEDGFNYSFHTTVNLYDWALDRFWLTKLPNTESALTSVPLHWCEQSETVAVYAADSRLTLMDDESGIELVYDGLPQELNAPVTAGTGLGTVTVLQNGQQLFQTELIAMTDYQRSKALYLKDTLRPYLPAFIGLFVVLALVATVVVLRMRAVRRSRRRVRIY